MRKWLLVLLSVALSAPAQASGGNVLGLLWAELLLFVLVVVSLYFVKISFKNKIMIFGFYFLATVCAIWLTAGIPYSNNVILINTISIALPILAWFGSIAYFLKTKVKSEEQHNNGN